VTPPHAPTTANQHALEMPSANGPFHPGLPTPFERQSERIIHRDLKPTTSGHDPTDDQPVPQGHLSFGSPRPRRNNCRHDASSPMSRNWSATPLYCAPSRRNKRAEIARSDITRGRARVTSCSRKPAVRPGTAQHRLPRRNAGIHFDEELPTRPSVHLHCLGERRHSIGPIAIPTQAPTPKLRGDLTGS